MKRLAFLLALALPFTAFDAMSLSPAAGGGDPVPPALSSPATVNVAPGRMATITLTTTCKSVVCINLNDDVSDVFREYTDSGFTFRFLAPGKEVPPAIYKLVFVGAVADKPVTSITAVMVGAPAPIPIPPGPGPGPDPPLPDPPDPFTGEKAGAGAFRCLIVYDSSTLKTLPIPQRDILYSTVAGGVRDYAALHAIKGTGGPDFRVWPTDQDPTNEAAVWQRVMKRERKSLPWLVVGNGRTGWEGPLPATPDATITKLKLYAEVK